MFKRIPSADVAFKVLNFIRSASTGTPAVKPAPVGRWCVAQVITMPPRRTAVPARGAPVAVISRVTEEVGKLFPQLKGAIREEMIAAISHQVSEDPHASQLIAS